MSAANPETPNSTISREASTESASAAASQGRVLPEGKIMPNTVFVGGINDRMDETEVRNCFGRYGSVKEVKIIMDRTGVSKGYGFVSFFNDVDVQKILESQIHFHGKKLKLGPAIRKQKLRAHYVQPRPLVFNPPPPPQFRNVCSNPNAENYLPPPIAVNPVTQYVQAYPTYPNSPGAVITGNQLAVYNYQALPVYPNLPVQVTTGYQLPVHNYQAFPVYPNSPVQVTTGYQWPIYNYQAFPVYPDSPVQVTTGYQMRIHNYQVFPIYPDSPFQVTTGYQLSVCNYQVFRDYRNSPVQVTTGYQLPVRNYLIYPTYPNSRGQVTTGHQLPVCNYQMPPQ
ncbi:deleted in azoospermia protein 3-like [Piliocolobus tephrosceles]|uniref:deleted in azoospermia protein 3-like n=1 Tax=Piliocolobus tephrosceles TaxID=591936 RepID=UPI000E6AF895|nr:deleted in azoospermia protein 3-like [Piliocolobus tephrosceles]